MNTRKLNWLRLRNWAAFVALVPVVLVACIVLSPYFSVFATFQVVNNSLKGGLK